MPPEASAGAITHALAERDRTTLQPAGVYAANTSRLSEQVPAGIVFLIDGPASERQKLLTGSPRHGHIRSSGTWQGKTHEARIPGTA
ncbi:MAG UNVERIFIED_CONTAM: DUF6088 family protein [Planctomycetaceae bacterium]